MSQDFTFAFDPFLPHWILTGFAATSLVLFAMSVRGNVLRSCLRLCYSALLLIFLSQPQLVRENRKPLNDVVLVAVDKSLSQEFGDRKAQTVNALGHLRSELGKLTGLDIRTIDVAVNAADETKVFDAIESAFSDVTDGQRAGTILLTDGQVTDKPAADFLKAAPLHVLLTGRRTDRDREIKIVNAPGYSILGEPAVLKFRIEDHNIAGAPTALVRLNLPDGTTQTRTVRVGEDQDWPLPIENAGQNIFELSVDPLENELSLLNNRAVVNVQGVRNRLHVLLVSGEPYPGARMWRDLLKADPGVDLVHFTILRSPDKIDTTPPDQLSLIAFPFQELFERKLNSFDLIIMDRFSLNTVLPDYYFQNMKNYVLQGGALLEISGPSYATPASMYNTSLGEILPGAPNGSTILRQPFKPAVTDLGKTHPVTMALAQRPDWGNWLQQVPVTRRTGDVLMTGIDGNPLLILARSGKGRVAQMTSDQIWLWARGFQGGGPTTELLRRIVHWLMKEPELDETALNADASGTDIHLRTRDLESGKVLQVTKPDGSTETVALTKAQDGWLSGDLKNLKQGVYKFSDGQRTKIVALGDTTTPEFSNIMTTDRTLKPYIEQSGGASIWTGERPNFQVRNSTSQSRFGGYDAIGLKRNHASSVISSDAKPILPPEFMAALALLAGLFLWWFESRRSRN